jgi:DNA polymerase-3 subunit epsilon
LTCGAVSVAIVRFERGVEVGHFYSLVNPHMPIPAEATAIHGISDEMVAGHYCLQDFLDTQPAELSLGAVPVAYNATYDRAILHRHVSDPSVPAYDHAQQWLCPLTIVRDADRFVRGQGRHQLANVCERRGIAMDKAHNALSDARATGFLLLQLLESGAVKSCQLGKLLAHVERRRVEQERDFLAYRQRMERAHG